MTDEERASEERQASYGPPENWYWPPPTVVLPSAHRSRRRKAVIGSVAAVAVTAITVGAVATAVGTSKSTQSDQAVVTVPQAPSAPSFPDGQGQTTPDTGGSAGTNTSGLASAAQQVGVVDIDTVLDFGSGKAAATGIVLSANGEILTNNHVVQDSTSITVTVVSTGKQYAAKVVGTDPADDVAVIQLQDASGLQTAKLGNSATVAPGDRVTGVGNAGGSGGVPNAATGTVIALDQSITASDTNGSNAEQLTAMIGVDAAIAAGDSGGPLYSADDLVIGMDTAASSSRRIAATTGFAIPIAKAVSIAEQIESGKATSTIHIGYPAFLGVQLAAGTTSGVAISGVVSGSAAENAGLKTGDSITGVDGAAVASPAALAKVMAGHQPGDQVRISWVNSAGKSHTATVTLGSGPAD